MGYAICWLAVRGRPPEKILQELGLRERSGENDGRALITGCRLPGEWYLLFLNRFLLPPEGLLGALSRDGEAVWCVVEEHVMFSAAAKWQNGSLIWSVTHESEKGIDHLEIQGALSAGYRDICMSLLEKQRQEGGAAAGVDYVFDVPVNLARAETGYQHDLARAEETAPVVLEACGSTTEFQKLLSPPSGCLSAMVLLFPWVAGWWLS